jgi:hypothetical protein
MAKLYWRLKVNGKWSWKPVFWSEMINRTAGDFIRITKEEEE